MTRYCLATFNRDKARELEALLGLPGVTLVPVADMPGATAPDEDGDSLLANARIKARAALAVSGLPSLADDTGLEVDALAGAPGIHAARFAGPAATYADNVALMLERMRGVPAARRTARFRTVMVAAFPDGRELQAEGVLEGVITEAPSGSGGFGYDPIFALPDGRTLAQLDSAEKNAISHRARAAKALSSLLASA